MLDMELQYLVCLPCYLFWFQSLLAISTFFPFGIGALIYPVLLYIVKVLLLHHYRTSYLSYYLKPQKKLALGLLSNETVLD